MGPPCVPIWRASLVVHPILACTCARGHDSSPTQPCAASARPALNRATAIWLLSTQASTQASLTAHHNSLQAQAAVAQGGRQAASTRKTSNPILAQLGPFCPITAETPHFWEWGCMLQRQDAAPTSPGTHSQPLTTGWLTGRLRSGCSHSRPRWRQRLSACQSASAHEVCV